VSTKRQKSETIAVFSDVHSDFHALRSVLDAIESAGIERVFCLGDLVGSGGTNPVECVDWGMERCDLMLAGNHERFVTEGVFRTLAGGWADHAYRAAVQLGEQRIAALAKLPRRVLLDDLGVELVHGSLANYQFGFVDSRQAAADTLARASAPIVLCGHTHHAACWVADPWEGAVARRFRVGVEMQLPNEACILNPGAVCDSDGARYLVLRLGAERRSATWHRTAVHGHGGRHLPQMPARDRVIP